MTAVDETVRHWLIPLQAEPEEYGTFLNMLDDEQRLRAARMHDPARRQPWVIAWARARQYLGEYLDRPPQALRFVRDSWGKPHLACGEAHFNLSHSRAWCLLAASRRHALGVDLECWRPDRDVSALVRRCCSPAERAWWESLPEGERIAAFFRLWTCKEAFVKAVGRGIGAGLSQCEFRMDGEPRLVAVPPGCGLAQDWRLRIVPAPDGYHAAMAQGL